MSKKEWPLRSVEGNEEIRVEDDKKKDSDGREDSLLAKTPSKDCQHKKPGFPHTASENNMV